jgi:3-methylcrotonyl-CoA carboxylase alpha subunit
MADYHFAVGDKQFHLKLEPCADGFCARIGDRTYRVQVQPHPDGQLDLLVDGQRHRLFSARASDQANQRMLWLDGQRWTVTSVDPKTGRQAQSVQHTEGRVSATVPGQVRAILVAVGDEVSAGQPLLILEAMKMEMRVLAPQPGKIGKINCALGDVVARGQWLVEMEG